MQKHVPQDDSNIKMGVFMVGLPNYTFEGFVDCYSACVAGLSFFPNLLSLFKLFSTFRNLILENYLFLNIMLGFFVSFYQFLL